MHHLIVMLPNNLGDVIMALPVLEAIRAAQPHTRISFFVEKGYEGGLLENRCCDRILQFPRKSIKTAATTPQWYEGVASLRSIIDEIKSDGCDAVVNLAQHPYVSYLTTLLAATHTCGQRFLREGNHALPDGWSQYLYAIPFARRYNALHATDVYCRIAGVTSGHGGTAVTITPDEKARAAHWLADHGCLPSERIAVVQPGAAWSSKRWPHDAYIALGKRLARDGYRIVVTGAAPERPVAAAIVDGLDGHALLTAGSLSFRETMALLPFGRFIVCGDTAIMHAAAALGVKVYALFGPTSPVETGPYGEGHVVVAGRCTKRPCFSVECATRECMRSILPDTLYGCIHDGTVAQRECDILTTGFSGGTFRTEPLGGLPHPYYDEAGAALTRKAFEPEFTAALTDEGYTAERSRSQAFIEKCREMGRLLGDYLCDRNPELLQAFERIRAEAAAGDGISAFWNALLNIRLNSVPLLDPVAGIGLSIEQCRFTAEQISRAVAS
jgi:heptosyltransferase-1